MEEIEKVYVVVVDYAAEPDWDVVGIFTTMEGARLVCENSGCYTFRIETVPVNKLLRYWDDVA